MLQQLTPVELERHMSTIISEPRFSSNAWNALETLEKRFRARVLNLLEDRMREQRRSQITADDVQECVKQASREMVEDL